MYRFEIENILKGTFEALSHLYPIETLREIIQEILNDNIFWKKI